MGLRKGMLDAVEGANQWELKGWKESVRAKNRRRSVLW